MKPSQSLSDILWLESTESTNKALREHSGGCDNLSVLACLEQTAGRGQGTHSWHSRKGENLTFSILFRPSGLAATEIILITCAVTLGLLDYLREKGVKGRIKWPNDIWVEDKKICGILIENALEGAMVRESIIGVGFNLNQKEWPSELPNPVSLSQLTGAEYNLQEELQELATKIRRRLSCVSNGGSELQEEFGKNVFRLV